MQKRAMDLSVHASLLPSLQTPSLPTPVAIPVFPVAAIVCVVVAVFLLLVIMALILRKYLLVCLSVCVWVRVGLSKGKLSLTTQTRVDHFH